MLFDYGKNGKIKCMLQMYAHLCAHAHIEAPTSKVLPNRPVPPNARVFKCLQNGKMKCGLPKWEALKTFSGDHCQNPFLKSRQPPLWRTGPDNKCPMISCGVCRGPAKHG